MFLSHFQIFVLIQINYPHLHFHLFPLQQPHSFFLEQNGIFLYQFRQRNIPLATKIPLCWQQEQGFSNADWSVLSQKPVQKEIWRNLLSYQTKKMAWETLKMISYSSVALFSTSFLLGIHEVKSNDSKCLQRAAHHLYYCQSIQCLSNIKLPSSSITFACLAVHVSSIFLH